jgi:hypothetical protein
MQNLVGNSALCRPAQNGFCGCAVDFEGFGHGEEIFGDAMIQKRQTDFAGKSHGAAIGETQKSWKHGGAQLTIEFIVDETAETRGNSAG